ncbi:MAG: methyltransferase domain-containing protein [Myxococcales bacterium]|nr:methyltransferase domain-containing protein [Myxococcales bacterium]
MAARDVLADERVLVLGRHPAALRCLLDHARLTAVAPAPAPGVDLVARSDRLPLGTARFDHVIAAAWLQDTYDPVGALTTAARALTHGGFLHLLAWGPGPDAPADAGLRLSLDALIEICGRAGLVLEGVDARDAVGAAVDPGQATVLVVAARRHIV